MKIVSCKIFDFGKLHDKEIFFNEGLNNINEPNGWGKSTLTAFIKAMLYGLEGDGKRDELASDRRHYKPWQGGTFGGSITFEEKGKTYVATRTFGAKAGTDTFELRDAFTNLPSSDHSEHLGEELFGINAESFARTVFIRQNDSEYLKAADDINAKLGNISDSMDINRFQAIDDAIKNELNALSSTRKTGAIYKARESATELKARIAGAAGAEESASVVRSRLESYKEELSSITEDKRILNDLRTKASLYEKRKADRETFDRLVTDLKVKEDAFYAAKAGLSYSGAGDAGDAIDSIIDLTGKLSEARRVMASVELTEDEKARFSHYRERISDPDQTLVNTEEATRRLYSASSYERSLSDKEASASDLEFALDETFSKKKHLRIDLVLSFLSLMAGGVFTYLFVMRDSGNIMLYAALVFLGLAAVLLTVFFVKGAGVSREALMLRSRIDKLKKEIADIDGVISEAYCFAEKVLRDNGRLYDPNSAINELKELHNDCLEYKSLYDKYRRFADNDRTEECERLSSEIRGLFGDFGLSPEESEYSAVLSSLVRKNEALKSQKELYSDAFKRKEEFEKNADPVSLTKTDEISVSLEEINDREALLDSRAEEIKRNSDIDRRQLEDLTERLDMKAELEDRLSELNAEIGSMTERVSLLEDTRDYLTRARENLTARYIGPLKEGFAKYYSIITGGKPDAFLLDANLDLTVSGGGLQHPLGFLSYGYKDLVGVCMRLALADAMYTGEKPFLILDDPFVNLDENNRSGAMKLLEAVAQDYQIVYFTCR